MNYLGSSPVISTRDTNLTRGIYTLVSCGDINHGYIGRFNIPPNKRYANAITVAYNGIPLTAKYRPYEFGAKDDIGVLLPRESISQISLVYITAILNSMRWQFSYGRKCFKEKFGSVKIMLPVTRGKGSLRVDEFRIRSILGECNLDKRPSPNEDVQPMPQNALEGKATRYYFRLAARQLSLTQGFGGGWLCNGIPH